MATPALGGAVRRVRARLAAELHRDLNDRQLLERFLRQHDESAFTALVQRHERRVYSALTKVLRDPADVEDAFQATFLVLVRKASSVRWREGLGTWLYAVAHRVAVHARSQVRSRLRREGRAAGRAEPASAPPDLSWREACALVHEELDRLPERLRLPLLLCYLEGLSREEAAARLGVSATTVKGRLERGRDLLRGRLTRRGIVLTAGLLAALAGPPARASAPALVALAVAAANCPSARVASLARGVTATMILSKFKLAVGLLLAAGLVGVILGARSPAASTAAPAQRAGEKAAAGGKDADREGEVAGRVLDESGKPVAGAKLSLWTGSGKPRAVGETGADGRFRFRLGKADLAGQAKLIAKAAGRGPDWVNLRNRPAGEVTLRLEKDVPIRWRVLDLEGRPVAGATVQVREVAKSAKGDLTAYLDAWKDVMKGVPIPPLVTLPPKALGVPASTTTDKEGRFRLEGVGRERRVDLAIRGRGIEQRWVWVITRPGFKTGPGAAHGPSFDLLVGPGKELTGVVKDKRTGRPVAGARVTCQVGEARTDAKGRFRIEGLRKQPQYFGWATSPGYFQKMLEVKDTPGREPMHLDVEIQRGLYVEGRLRDRATGKPVSGVVDYFIRSDNPHLKDYAFSPGTGLGSGPAGPGGKFRILTFPGRGYLVVRADRNVYTRATLKGWDGAPLETAPHGLFPYYYHAIVPIDPDEKKPASRKVEITLDPGRTTSGSVVGPDGKPVTGVIAFGLTAVPDPGAQTFPRPDRFGPPPPERLKDSTFTAVGLNPKEPRHLVFIHPEKKLGKVVRVRGDEKGPLVVKLQPLGAVSGRVLTGEGEPAGGRLVAPCPANLFAYYKDYPIELLHNDRHQPQRMGRLILWQPDAAKTDSGGKFRLEGLLGGLKYTLRVTDRPSGPMVIPSHWVDVTVEAGKTKDLGDLKRVGKD
jgi:RNA polymerase sigma factor (sigma-70 family)